jgi:hypothetical protein
VFGLFWQILGSFRESLEGRKLFVINPFDKRLDVLKTKLGELTFYQWCKFSRNEFINEEYGSQPGLLAKWYLGLKENINIV